MNSMRGWAGVPAWEVLHCGFSHAFEGCAFMAVFLIGENPTDLTHMNGPAADICGCCLVMCGKEDGVKLYLINEERWKSDYHIQI